MGCGSSIEGVEKKDDRPKQQHDRTHSTSGAAGDSSTQVEDFTDDERRTSIVPPQPSSDSASPTKLPGKTNAPIPVSSARISRNGEQPVLAPLDQQQQQATTQQQQHPYHPSGDISAENRASLSNSVGQMDPTSEHRSSYRRFMQQAGSPTYAMRDDAPRASINSLISNSQSMAGIYAPVNNLSMPFSPTVGAASRSSFSSSTTTNALPPMASIQRAGGNDRGLSILSQSTNASEMSGSQTSSTRHTMSSDPVEGGVAPMTTTLTMSQQRSIESSTTHMSPQKKMASLPLSLEEGYLNTPTNSSKSEATANSNNRVTATMKREIDAAQYPFNQYGFYPVESAGENFKAPSGPREKDRPRNDNTPTQSYSGQYFAYYYVREMQRRRDEDEQIISQLTEGRELERYKYRRRPQMPMLSLTSDSVMCEEEHQKVKRCNFSLSDVKNPVQQPSAENSRMLHMDRYYSMREEKEKQKQAQQKLMLERERLPSPALQIISPHRSPSTVGPLTNSSNNPSATNSGVDYASPNKVIVAQGGGSSSPSQSMNNSVTGAGNSTSSFSTRYRRDVQQARETSTEDRQHSQDADESNLAGAEKTRVLRGYPSRTATPTTEAENTTTGETITGGKIGSTTATQPAIEESESLRLGSTAGSSSGNHQKALAVTAAGSSTQPSLNTSHVIMGDIGQSPPDSKSGTQTLVSSTGTPSPTASSTQRVGSAVHLVRAARSEERQSNKSIAEQPAVSSSTPGRVGLPALPTVPPIVPGSGETTNPMGGMPPSSARSIDSGADPTSARGSVASLQQQFSSVRSQPLPPTPRQQKQQQQSQQQSQMEQLPGAIAA